MAGWKGQPHKNDKLTANMKLYKVWWNYKKDWPKYRDFYVWAMLNGYTDGKVLCKRDSRKPHSIANSIWLTKKESNRRRAYVKLTEDDVRRIKLYPADSAKSLAHEYGVSKGTIDKIRAGELWADVE